MYISVKELESLSLDNINRLIDDKVSEGKFIDYKLNLIISSYDEKKEFLQDVSSFANAEGGHLIIGVEEKESFPIAAPGIETDIDKLILKMENLIRDGIEPRIQGIIIKHIKLATEKYIIVIFIPKSFNPPHVTKIEKHWRFYSRNSKGKFPLDVYELRSLFNMSSSAIDQMQDFRLKRITKIKRGELPVSVTSEPHFIFHFVPLASFGLSAQIPLSKFDQIRYHEKIYDLIKSFNYEGILMHNGIDNESANYYCQIFRNGIIEVFTSYFHDPAKKVIYAGMLEKELITNTNFYFDLLKLFEISFPIIFFCSVLGVEGYKIKIENFSPFMERQNKPLSPNNMIFPHVMFTDISNSAIVLKSTFDNFWNAGGFAGSPNYNNNGEWEIRK